MPNREAKQGAGSWSEVWPSVQRRKGRAVSGKGLEQGGEKSVRKGHILRMPEEEGEEAGMEGGIPSRLNRNPKLHWEPESALQMGSCPMDRTFSQERPS